MPRMSRCPSNLTARGVGRVVASSFKQVLRRAVVTSAASVLALAVGVPAADATPSAAQHSGRGRGGVSPRGCLTDNYYKYSSVATSAIRHAIVYGQSGVTLTITETAGTSITGTVGGSGTFTVGAIVAEAQAQVNASIAYTKTSSVTRGGSWTVPSTQSQGWLADGAQSRKMNWIHYQDHATCTTSTIGSGTANLPTLAPYIYHS